MDFNEFEWLKASFAVGLNIQASASLILFFSFFFSASLFVLYSSGDKEIITSNEPDTVLDAWSTKVKTYTVPTLFKSLAKQ